MRIRTYKLEVEVLLHVMAKNQLKYHPGFGSEISSEALPHALPKGQVSSRKSSDC